MSWLSRLFAKAKPVTWRIVKHEVIDKTYGETRYVIESSDGRTRDLRGGPSFWRYYPSGECAEAFHRMLQEWEAQREWFEKEGKPWP